MPRPGLLKDEIIRIYWDIKNSGKKVFTRDIAERVTLSKMTGNQLKTQIAVYLREANLPYERSTLGLSKEARAKAKETIKKLKRPEHFLSETKKAELFADIRKYRSGVQLGPYATMHIRDFARYFPEETSDLMVSRNINRIANDILKLPAHPAKTPKELLEKRRLKTALKKKGDPTWISGELKGTQKLPLHHMRAKGISPALNNLTYIDVLKNSEEFQRTGVEPLRNKLNESMKKVFADKKSGWEKELEKLNFQSRHYANKIPKHLKGLIVFEQMDKFGNFTEKGIGGNPIKALGKATELGDIKFDTLTKESPLRRTILDFANTVKNSAVACRAVVAKAVGSSVAGCVETIKRDPVGSANKLAAMEATSGALGKVKNVATTFLGTLGKFGARAAPLAAVAALGAVAEPLVKQFRNDDYSTYLSDPEQQGSMLLAMVEQETPKVDQEILKWKYPGEVAAIGAGAIPGAGELYKQRRAIRPDKFIGPMQKGVGPTRAALGISGVLGKALGATFSPLAVAATLPFNVAAQRSAGTDYSDIVADPGTWMGPAFASTGAQMATKGIQNPMLLRALRLGFSPGALRAFSSRLGLPGLALTGGMWGYDKWKNWGKDKDDEFKVRTYKDDDD